jgi:diguanylate cyclase (GGDEF)-like protein
MVGRYGGEEFLVVLNKCNPASAVARAENLRAAIGARPIATATKPVRVTVSIGLALSLDFPDFRIATPMKSFKRQTRRYMRQEGGAHLRPSGTT